MFRLGEFHPNNPRSSKLNFPDILCSHYCQAFSGASATAICVTFGIFESIQSSIMVWNHPLDTLETTADRSFPCKHELQPFWYGRYLGYAATATSRLSEVGEQYLTKCAQLFSSEVKYHLTALLSHALSHMIRSLQYFEALYDSEILVSVRCHWNSALLYDSLSCSALTRFRGSVCIYAFFIQTRFVHAWFIVSGLWSMGKVNHVCYDQTWAEHWEKVRDTGVTVYTQASLIPVCIGHFGHALTYDAKVWEEW